MDDNMIAVLVDWAMAVVLVCESDLGLSPIDVRSEDIRSHMTKRLGKNDLTW